MSSRATDRLRTEAVLAGALLSFGVLVVPFAVYLVGSRVVGEYRPGAGPMDLVSDVWTALAAGEPAAWVLVTSPYLVIQLVRLARLAWRSRPV